MQRRERSNQFLEIVRTWTVAHTYTWVRAATDNSEESGHEGRSKGRGEHVVELLASRMEQGSDNDFLGKDGVNEGGRWITLKHLFAAVQYIVIDRFGYGTALFDKGGRALFFFEGQDGLPPPNEW